MSNNETQGRKDDHLNLCVQKDVSSRGSSDFESLSLPHCALPDIDFSQINLETTFLNQKFSAPFLISSMTGGSEKGERINDILCNFAQDVNIPMGVGSQRIALEDKIKNKSSSLFNLRKNAPKAVLYANIGAVQLGYGVSIDDCRYLAENLQAQAFILHLNPLQEAIQKEGDRNFSNLWPKIEKLCKELPIPVILKETGCGLDVKTSKRALEVGVSALDLAAFGGTHWGYIEGLRHSERAFLGDEFRSWGIPTRECIENNIRALGWKVPMIASGGIRTGLDAAKSLYLGAHMAGLALPFLIAAEKDLNTSASLESALHKLYNNLKESLKIALFCTNSKSIDDLRQTGKKAHYEN